MTTIILMLSLVLVFAVIAILGVRYKPDKDSFFDLKDTVVLKGLFCVIVVLVHVPSQYQNPIQDGIGSFAYIGVTFFFMTSAFGLMYNVAQKEGYLREFWRRRLPPLLIPALLCNALSIAVSTMEKNQITLWSAINIGAWVKVLLLYYFSFWIIKIIPGGVLKEMS